MITHFTLVFAWVFSLPFLNAKRQAPFYLITFGVLFLFMALRFNYGNDYDAYRTIHFQINSPVDTWGDKEVLFKFINMAIPNFYLLLTILSFFYLITIYFLIKNNLKVHQYWFSILLLLLNPYLFLVHLSSIRQTIAICIVVFAMYFVKERKLFKYIALILIAAGFHYSSLFLLPFYFLLSGKKIRKNALVLIMLFVLFLVFTPLFNVFLNFSLNYFPQYRFYIVDASQNSIRSAIIASFFFLFVLFNINKLEGKEIIYGKLALISTVFSLLAFKLTMLTRVGMYFEIFLIVAIPLLISKMKTRASKQILIPAFILIYLLKYISFFNNPTFEPFYRNYQTILGY